MSSNIILCVYLFVSLFIDMYSCAKLKRSPLETGYVTSISDDNNQHVPHNLFLTSSAAKETTSSAIAGAKVIAPPVTLVLHKPEMANLGCLGDLFPGTLFYGDVEQKPSVPAASHLQSSSQAELSPSSDHPLHHTNHHILVWLPGRVYHHAYIPPHLEHQHHLVVPDMTRSHVVIHNHDGNNRAGGHRAAGGHELNHYGGYGVGADTGGQGAGHGWQVIGMLYNSF